MADANLQQFDKRVRRIYGAHKKMAGGYVGKVGADGLIIVRPRRVGPRFPFKFMFLTVLALLLFKGFLFANLGAVTYKDRVAKLARGTAIERAGAWVMAPDALTILIAQQARRLKS